MYKKLVVSAAVVFMLSSAAYAENVTGSVEKINPQEGTINLSDGNTYKLPGEFDYSIINEGMNVAITYDLDGDVRQVSGLDPEAKAAN